MIERSQVQTLRGDFGFRPAFLPNLNMISILFISWTLAQNPRSKHCVTGLFRYKENLELNLRWLIYYEQLWMVGLLKYF